ncbi:MAG: glycerol-3-phosphate 1-O-acyltransferase PlsY [Trueperaceae bacterium]|nr:glycerol-3-phosphate 1-O-acyltransferase PlsY [Trueperaceae bacterium]
MSTVSAVLLIILAYFLGCIPTGLLIARARGVDIRQKGSGNIGATNVLRSVGLVPAIVVIIADPLKGFLAAFIPKMLGMDPWVVGLAALAAVIGHNFNIFLRFRGGKGIATTLGSYLAIDPLLTLFAAIVGIATIALGRMVSLGSLIGLLAALLLFLYKGVYVWPQFFVLTGFLVLAFVRHWSNIQKLAKGTERRIGQKSS